MPATKHTRSAVCQSCKRQRMDLWNMRPALLVNYIAVTAAGLNEVLAEFAAQVADVKVKQVGIGFFSLGKKVVVKFGAAANFAAPRTEVFQQGIFAGGQRNVRTADGDGA